MQFSGLSDPLEFTLTTIWHPFCFTSGIALGNNVYNILQGVIEFRVPIVITDYWIPVMMQAMLQIKTPEILSVGTPRNVASEARAVGVAC